LNKRFAELRYDNVSEMNETLVVEAPQIDRRPFPIGPDRFVLPVRVELDTTLAVVNPLRLPKNRRPAVFFLQEIALQIS